MLTESDLNRIKGLLHFLNGRKPDAHDPDDHPTGRRIQLDDVAGREDSAMKFDIIVRGADNVVLGHIIFKDGEYRFGVLA